MNESLAEFLFNMAIVVFFIVAGTLYFLLYGFSSDMVDFIRDDISNQNEIIRVIEEKKEVLVSGDEILSDIMTGSVDEFTLVINGVSTYYTVDNPLEFDEYSCIDLNAWYTAIPKLDSSGDVIVMEYIKK